MEIKLALGGSNRALDMGCRREVRSENHTQVYTLMELTVLLG